MPTLETTIKFSADTEQGKQKIAEFAGAVKQASGEISASESKATGAINNNTGAQFANWRESKRMSGGMQSLAYSFAGVSGPAAQAMGVLNLVGASMEKTELKGRNFGDVLKSMKGEIQMLAQAGALALLAFAFKKMNDDMKATLDLAIKVDQQFQKLQADMYADKIDRISKAYKDGAISAEEFRAKAIGISKALANVTANPEIEQAVEKSSELSRKLSASWVQGAGLSTAAWTKAWNKISGGSVETKIQVLNNQVVAATIAAERELAKKTQEINEQIAEQEAEKAARRAEQQRKAAAERMELLTAEYQAKMAAWEREMLAQQGMTEWLEQLSMTKHEAELQRLAEEYEMGRMYIEQAVIDKEQQVAALIALQERYAAAVDAANKKEAASNKIKTKQEMADEYFAAKYKGALQSTYGGFVSKIQTDLIAGNKVGVAHMVADTLKALGVQWAMEGAAGIAKGIISNNPAMIAAGGKLMALGGGAAATGFGMGAMQRRDTGMPELSLPGAAGGGATAGGWATAGGGASGGGAGGGARGGESVAKTSNVIHLNSIMNVYGNVIGIDKFRELFTEWQYENIRLVAADMGGA